MLENLTKNKTVLVAVIGILLLAVVGGYFLFANKGGAPVEEEDGIVEEEFESLSPDEIGLEMVASSDNTEVRFVINKPEGFNNVEYELSYEANDRANPGNRVTRGVAGEDEMSGDVYESEDLFLGTCSSGTCIPDTGVEQVDLLLILTKTDGKKYQVKDSLTIE